MVTKIVYDYEKMKAASSALKASAEKYKEYGTKLKSDIETATQGFEGESKIKFTTLMQSVNTFTTQSIPEMINGIAALLDNNIENMSTTDSEIAAQIPNSI